MSRLLTPGELAEYLQVTEATLADWRYRGKGPRYVKVGRLVRYSQEDDVDTWLASNTAGGDPPGAASIVRLVGSANAGR
ncbi:MAG: helix-turn-helix domain-containing protein [Actinomycetia bacterium]|nr:helix-turn-helix domain-containing protein [Actinomycetes bacterium]